MGSFYPKHSAVNVVLASFLVALNICCVDFFSYYTGEQRGVNLKQTESNQGKQSPSPILMYTHLC